MKPSARAVLGEADGRQDRGPLGHAVGDAAGHERLELLGSVVDLQLEEPGAGVDLLQRPLGAVLQRRGGGVLDGTDEQVRRGRSSPAGQVHPRRP